jgi:hypothetical protein
MDTDSAILVTAFIFAQFASLFGVFWLGYRLGQRLRRRAVWLQFAAAAVLAVFCFLVISFAGPPSKFEFLGRIDTVFDPVRVTIFYGVLFGGGLLARGPQADPSKPN